MIFVPDAQLSDERPKRFEDLVECIAIAGEDHPGGERAGAFAAESVESLVDNIARVGLAGAGAFHGRRNAACHRIGDRSGEGALEAGGGAEVVEQIGVGASDLRRNGFEGHRLGTILDQQPARRRDRGGAAFFRAKARSLY